jgi:cyclic pyranopterin monophosphate synthase
MDYSYSYRQTDIENDRKELIKPNLEAGEAVSEGVVALSPTAFQAFLERSAEGASDIWALSKLSGVMGAKQADERLLVPYIFNITGVDLSYKADESTHKITVTCVVRTKERISAASAALVGCGMALMTLVNSLRSIDREISIENLRVVK